MEMYRLLYPRADGGSPGAFLGDTESRVEQWRQAGACSVTATRSDSSELVIMDTRPNAVHRQVGMNGVQREVYELCDQRRHLQGILRSIADRYVLDDGVEGWLREFLSQMVDWRLMASEGDEYLSLAIQDGAGFEGTHADGQ